MKKILISLLITTVLLFASCGGGGAETGDGWTRDMGTPTLKLTDNFEYGAGYQGKYNPPNLFNGDKVREGDEYTLQITFKASRDLEGLLFAGLVDENPNGQNPYWTELAYPVGGPIDADIVYDAARILAEDAEDVANGVQFAGVNATTLIKEGVEITAELKWTAQRDSTGTSPTNNTLYFQTRGEGKTRDAGSGKKGEVTLTFTKFIFTKAGSGSGDDDDNKINCDCAEGTEHFEESPCDCGDGACLTGGCTNCKTFLRPATSYKITSPYEGVDWVNWRQYRTGLHIHTTSSDGNTDIETQVNRYYDLGYEVLAITDHNNQGLPYTSTWTGTRVKSDVPMTAERYAEITSGAGRTPPMGGMFAIPNTSEIAAYPDEINTYWWAGAPGIAWSQTRVLDAVEEAGGIASINHPGRATGGMASTLAGFNHSMNPIHINRYAGYFLKYNCLTSMEIVNRSDGDTYHDRVLWDNILKVTARQGKNVFGRADDDAHSSSADNTGLGWNMFVMPSNSEENVKNAMLNGNFYAVARNAHREGVSNRSGVNAPAIRNIVIGDNDSLDASITITVQNADKVDFITERQGPLGYYNIVHTANRPTGTAAAETWDATIVLKDAKNAARSREIVGNFVRANIVGSTGIAFSQPFIIERELDLSGE